MTKILTFATANVKIKLPPLIFPNSHGCHVIGIRRPDIVIINKTKNECKIIEFTCPFDSRIEKREKVKMKGYNDLKRKLKKILDMPVEVFPVVVGTLGINTKEMKAAVEWYRDWDKNSGIAENYDLKFYKDPPKCYWGLRSLVDTEPQEI